MSDRVVFARATTPQGCLPGQWAREEDGRVYIRCPHDHGHVAMIHRGQDHPDNWKISADGTVEPSVEYRMDDCGFHARIRLEGWAPCASPVPPAFDQAKAERIAKEFCDVLERENPTVGEACAAASYVFRQCIATAPTEAERDKILIDIITALKHGRAPIQ